MAQVNNLTVTGSSRFLNTINGACTDGTSGTTKYMRQDGTWQVPPNDNTDTNVTQTATDSTNANYEVLFSATADNTTRTEGARKSSGFIYNPSNHSVLIGSLKSNTTLGQYASAFGKDIEASGSYSHTEGSQSTASGPYSHAEGGATTASGDSSHAEGSATTASGGYSHAEGCWSTASGEYSHAEGYTTTASGEHSHVEGRSTTANHRSQHVFGEYNILDNSSAAVTEKGNYVEIVGNGTEANARSNARTLDWSGNEVLAGNLTLSGTTSDIILSGTNNTWDGTNTSLKTALSKKIGNTGSQTITNGSIYISTSTITTGVGFFTKNRNNIQCYLYCGDDSMGLYSDNGHGGIIRKFLPSNEVAINGATYSIANPANFRSAIGAAASSSRLTKKNIEDITEAEAKKILDIDVKSFDYKDAYILEGYPKRDKYYGVIAEDVLKQIPFVVNVPDDYDESKVDESKGLHQNLLTIDYDKFVPYLIKMVQVQQKEIEDLKQQITKTTN